MKKNTGSKRKKADEKFHTAIVVVVSLFVMLISFFAYMINTSLEEVLEKEYGSAVVTHKNAG